MDVFRFRDTVAERVQNCVFVIKIWFGSHRVCIQYLGFVRSATFPISKCGYFPSTAADRYLNRSQTHEIQSLFHDVLVKLKCCVTHLNGLSSGIRANKRVHELIGASIIKDFIASLCWDIRLFDETFSY